MKITKVEDRITPSLDKIQAQIRTLPRRTYQEWIRQTPKASGNARRRTDLRTNVIFANYPYAQRLNKGYSPKAPRGMSLPVLEWMIKQLRLILRK
jgi:hypothetical protein